MSTDDNPVPAGTHWVFIEREDGPHLVVGPYPDEPTAYASMTESLLIDSFCQEDATDCFLIPAEEIEEAVAGDEYELVIIDPNDGDHLVAPS